MDMGQILKNRFEVMPGQDGTYVVRLSNMHSDALPVVIWGFSNVDDLLHWLTQNAEALKNEKGKT